MTIADVCLIPQIYNAYRFEFSMESYPTLNRINKRCLALPYFHNLSDILVITILAVICGADYIVVKGNQGELHESLIKTFAKAKEYNYEAMVYTHSKTVEKDHGRIQTRHYVLLPLMFSFDLIFS